MVKSWNDDAIRIELPLYEMSPIHRFVSVAKLPPRSLSEWHLGWGGPPKIVEELRHPQKNTKKRSKNKQRRFRKLPKKKRVFGQKILIRNGKQKLRNLAPKNRDSNIDWAKKGKKRREKIIQKEHECRMLKVHQILWPFYHGMENLFFPHLILKPRILSFATETTHARKSLFMFWPLSLFTPPFSEGGLKKLMRFFFLNKQRLLFVFLFLSLDLLVVFGRTCSILLPVELRQVSPERPLFLKIFCDDLVLFRVRRVETIWGRCVEVKAKRKSE